MSLWAERSDEDRGPQRVVSLSFHKLLNGDHTRMSLHLDTSQIASSRKRHDVIRSRLCQRHTLTGTPTQMHPFLTILSFLPRITLLLDSNRRSGINSSGNPLPHFYAIPTKVGIHLLFFLSFPRKWESISPFLVIPTKVGIHGRPNDYTVHNTGCLVEFVPHWMRNRHDKQDLCELFKYKAYTSAHEVIHVSGKHS